MMFQKYQIYFRIYLPSLIVLHATFIIFSLSSLDLASNTFISMQTHAHAQIYYVPYLSYSQLRNFIFPPGHFLSECHLPSSSLARFSQMGSMHLPVCLHLAQMIVFAAWPIYGSVVHLYLFWSLQSSLVFWKTTPELLLHFKNAVT